MSTSVTIDTIIRKKEKNQKIVMLTAYDYPLARLLDEADVDIILVGDSLANVVLGIESTKDVGMNEMIYHTKAVSRGVKRALVIGDMPYEAYQKDVEHAADNANRLVQEGGAQAVKLEWFGDCVRVAKAIKSKGIEVMGHVGLTPQTADKLGGFKVQGKTAQAALNIIDQAKALEEAGCFSLVLECIPAEVSRKITEHLTIPTIGIGAGAGCDGQVLVTHDLLGLFDRYKPKFVKQYADTGEFVLKAIQDFRQDVLKEAFPDEEHSFHLPLDEIERLG